MAAENLVLHGRLTSSTGGNPPSRYRVTATFYQNFAIDLGDAERVVLVPEPQTAFAGPDGVFAVELAPKYGIQGATILTALASDGTTAGRTTFALNAIEQDAWEGKRPCEILWHVVPSLAATVLKGAQERRRGRLPLTASLLGQGSAPSQSNVRNQG